ncbi:unnamed protein product, partial [Closterium sp. NIES-54]
SLTDGWRGGEKRGWRKTGGMGEGDGEEERWVSRFPARAARAVFPASLSARTPQLSTPLYLAGAEGDESNPSVRCGPHATPLGDPAPAAPASVDDDATAAAAANGRSGGVPAIGRSAAAPLHAWPDAAQGAVFIADGVELGVPALPEQSPSRCPARATPRALPCPALCPRAALPCSPRAALLCSPHALRPARAALQPMRRPALQPALCPALCSARALPCPAVNALSCPAAREPPCPAARALSCPAARARHPAARAALLPAYLRCLRPARLAARLPCC